MLESTWLSLGCPYADMQIATFNINNVNKRLANLLSWLRQARPEVACLQELKAADSEFPVAAIQKGRLWRRLARGQKSWNGVAMLARDCEPVVTRTALPGDPTDAQSRYTEAAINGVHLDMSKAEMKKGNTAGCMKNMNEAHQAMGM